jgi:hypothetical protein
MTHSRTSLDQDLRTALDDALAALKAAEIQECHVDGDKADVISAPPGSNCQNEYRLIARCATGELWVKQAVAIAKAINFVRALAPKPTGTEAGRGVSAVPAGWKLVPAEPTEAMLWAGMDADQAFLPSEKGALTDHAETMWAAMLAATPTPPTPDSTAQGDGTSQEGTR